MFIVTIRFHQRSLGVSWVQKTAGYVKVIVHIKLFYLHTLHFIY